MYLNKLLTAVIITGLLISIAVLTEPATQAATPSRPIPTSATANKSGTYQSQGLRASINTLHADDKEVSVQLVIENITKVRQYVIVYGSYKATLDTGVFGTLHSESGLEFFSNITSTDAGNLHLCLDRDAKDLNDFSYIEPGEVGTALLKYDIQGATSANTVSFAFKAVVRSASGQGDADSLAEGGSKGTASAPHVVNINFPLVPIKSPE